jgi:hypothetical protein
MQRQEVIEALTSLNEDIESSIVAIDDNDAIEAWDRDNLNNWECMKDSLETVSEYIKSADELIEMVLSEDFDYDMVYQQAIAMRGGKSGTIL